MKEAKMGSKIERERKEVIESGSHLAHHSLNQRKIKHHLEGEQRAFPTSHYEARREKLRLEDVARLRRKDARILGAVIATLGGWEDTDH